jgi:hypothetical protein
MQIFVNLKLASRRLVQALFVPLILACSGDDLTGPSVADELLTGRRLAVSADNGKIAFESQRDGNAEIYVMNPDGSGETNLTNNPPSTRRRHGRRTGRRSRSPACGPGISRSS